MEMHGVGIDEYRHKLVGRPSFIFQANAFRGPFNRQLAYNPGQQLVALRVTPQDEVGGHVTKLDVRVVLHDGPAAELAVPLGDGVFHLSLHPFTDGGIHRLAGRAYHDKAVKKGIVNRPL